MSRYFTRFSWITMLFNRKTIKIEDKPSKLSISLKMRQVNRIMALNEWGNFINSGDIEFLLLGVEHGGYAISPNNVSRDDWDYLLSLLT